MSVAERIEEALNELRETLGDFDSIQRDTAEQEGDLTDAQADADRFATLGEQAVGEAYESALDVVRGLCSFDEHLATLDGLRNYAWADQRVSRTGTMAA